MMSVPYRFPSARFLAASLLLSAASAVQAQTASAGRDGAVYLASTEQSQLEFRQPIPKDTPHLHDVDLGEFTLGTVRTETAVEIQMTAVGRAVFGEKIAFTLRPE
jgi:hypothetical protein